VILGVTKITALPLIGQYMGDSYTLELNEVLGYTTINSTSSSPGATTPVQSDGGPPPLDA